MKKVSILLMLITLFSQSTCVNLFAQHTNKVTVPEMYKNYSVYTNPGKYEYVYENLPESLDELCRLIRTQFIHPHVELNQYRDIIPKERWREMFNYPSVESILEGLMKYDSSGLTFERKPEHRLVLGCQQNAILLASILKYQGIPARVRAGHVTYLIPDFHTSHTICEVWNASEKRWMLVDPSTDRVDFNSELFDFSNEAWIQLQNGEIDYQNYGVPRRYSGYASIIGKVHTDLASILGTEYPINQFAPMLQYAMEHNDTLTETQIETLNSICKLMDTLDAKNIKKLQKIYSETPEIQITQTFQPHSKN
jgi:hypothetical protein